MGGGNYMDYMGEEDGRRRREGKGGMEGKGERRGRDLEGRGVRGVEVGTLMDSLSREYVRVVNISKGKSG